MEIFFYIILAVFGCIFWSFASVIIYRLKSWEKGIVNGRSHCGKCQHILGFADLFPIFSFLFSWGKCRHCKSKIPFIYPLLEGVMALSFVLVGYFLIDFQHLLSPSFAKFEWIKFILFLILTFCTVVYTFYDIMYMEIPESILAIANITALIYLFFLSFYQGGFSYGEIAIFSVIVLFVMMSLYYFLLQERDERQDLFLLGCVWVVLLWTYFYFWPQSFDFPPLQWVAAGYSMFLFFYIQYFFSSWAWIGWGDFRIAILMWLMLGFSNIFIGFLATYISGSVIGISFLVYKYIKTKKFKHNMMIPFWPFLAFWIYFALFFGEMIKSFFNLYL